MCRLGGLQQRHPSPDIASTQTESPAGWQGFLFALHADELCRQGRHVSFRLAQAHRRLTQIQSKQASVERARGAGDARIVRLGHYLFVAEGEDGRSSMDTARLGIAASLFTRGCGKGKEWRELGVRRHGTPHSKGLGFGLRGRTVEKYRSQVDAQKVYPGCTAPGGVHLWIFYREFIGFIQRARRAASARSRPLAPAARGSPPWWS